jgi:hypothetical protein
MFTQDEGAIVFAVRRDITLYLSIYSQPATKSGISSHCGLRAIKDVDGTAGFLIRLLMHEPHPLLNLLALL